MQTWNKKQKLFIHNALDHVEMKDVQSEASNNDVKVEIMIDLKFLKQDKNQIS